MGARKNGTRKEDMQREHAPSPLASLQCAPFFLPSTYDAGYFKGKLIPFSVSFFLHLGCFSQLTKAKQTNKKKKRNDKII